MNDEEVKTRKRELLNADNAWRDAGLLPNNEKGSVEGYDIMKYLDGYRGDFAPVLTGGADAADQFVGNIMFSIVNTQIAQAAGRVPDPILRPIGGTAAGAEARRRAFLNEQVVRAIMREKKFKDEVGMAVLSSVLTPMGLVRHGFTPEVEWESSKDGRLLPRFKNQSPDLPWIQFMRPWQFRIDPAVNSFRPDSEPRWVAFQNLWHDYQIMENDNLIFRKDLKATHHVDLRAKHERRGKGNSSDFMPMYEEWVMYDFERQTFFGVSPGSNKLIREEKPWPFNWGQLPYSIITMNPQLDTPFGIPFPKMIWDELRMYNRVWTILNAMVSRTRRLMIFNASGFEDDQRALLENPDSLAEAIATNANPNEVISNFSFGTIDAQLIGMAFQLKEQIREVLGVSSFDRGQRANVETASEAQQIGAGGAVARGRNTGKVEDFWSNIIEVSHRSFLQNPDSRDFVIPLLGAENVNFLSEGERAQGFLKTKISDLQGEFDYAVRVNSTMKIDPAQELASFATAYNLIGGPQSQMANQQYAHERIFDLSGEDPRQAIVSPEIVQQMNKAQAGSGEEGGGETDSATGVAAQQGLPEVSGGL